MDRLNIKRKTLLKLEGICSSRLLSEVFDSLGQENILIDEGNRTEDKWKIDNFLSNENCPFIEKMKVLYAFEALYGEIIFKGRQVFYTVLTGLLNNRIECHIVRHYWQCTVANGIMPHFDLGEIIIPKPTDKYIRTKLDDTTFVIEKFDGKDYIPTEWIFQNKEDCDAKIEELLLEEET